MHIASFGIGEMLKKKKNLLRLQYKMIVEKEFYTMLRGNHGIEFTTMIV